MLKNINAMKTAIAITLTNAVLFAIGFVYLVQNQSL